MKDFKMNLQNSVCFNKVCFVFYSLFKTLYRSTSVNVLYNRELFTSI